MVTANDLLDGATAIAGGHARGATEATDLVDGVSPRVVVEPTTIDAVAATLAWASSKQLSVVVRGAGTKDAWGQPPERVDVLLRLHGLNRIVAHEAADLTVTVEAGIRLRTLNEHLGRHQQFLPIDPPGAGDATIGGILATNDSGPLRHRFGAPRDLLIGMTIVTADGRVSSSGGRVVKNVAGYDVGRLMTGSHGCLAAIVSASFKLLPLAPVSRTLRVRLPRASDASALVDLLRRHQLEPEAMEVHLSRTREGEHLSLLVRHASVESAVDDACRQTRACAAEIGASVEAADEGDEHHWWAAHASAPSGTGRTCLRLSWRPAEFERAAAALTAAADGADFDWTGRAAVGSGIVGVDNGGTAAAKMIAALRTGGIFGHVVLVNAPADLRREAGVWAVSGPQQTLWHALKSTFDPRGTFGAGRGPL